MKKIKTTKTDKKRVLELKKMSLVRLDKVTGGKPKTQTGTYFC